MKKKVTVCSNVHNPASVFLKRLYMQLICQCAELHGDSDNFLKTFLVGHNFDLFKIQVFC